MSIVKATRYNQEIEQRSNLTLEFPNGEIRRVPFFENPSINESKKANFVKYSPLGRSSPLYSYFNSDSRTFEVNFNISLDHVYDMFSKDLHSLTFPFDTAVLTQLTRQSFLNKAIAEKGVIKNDVSVSYNDAKYFDNEFMKLFPEETKHISSAVRKTKARVIDYIIYWLNLIRSTNLNNAQNPTQGPPIVRLNHGIMYQDVACICTNYKISSEESGNYDRNTFLPRLIMVSVSLAEIKHGDFGRYEVATAIKRDNIVGWEAIISRNGSKTIDPLPVRRNV